MHDYLIVLRQAAYKQPDALQAFQGYLEGSDFIALRQLYEAAVRAWHGSRVFLLQLNGECVGTQEAQEVIAYQEQMANIRCAAETRFGEDVQDEVIEGLIAEIEEDFHVLRELRNRLSKGASSTDCLVQFIGEVPERIDVLRKYLDEEAWCLVAFGEEKH